MTPVLYASPPAVGDAEPAHLYADLQSRTLWLGVDPLVNPVGAVLISDIVALQAADAAATVYTNTQVATRALTVHTHTASQITDFDAAVIEVVSGGGPDPIPVGPWVRGMILMWSGPSGEIGVGALIGWAICDGENGTPDLRAKFVISVGPGVAAGSANPQTIAETNLTGDHVHTLGPHALTEAQMPSHSHLIDLVATHTGGTSSEGTNHYHNTIADFSADDTLIISHPYIPRRNFWGTDPTLNYSIGGVDTPLPTLGRTSTDIGTHSHTLAGLVINVDGNTGNKGSGQVHTHTITNPVSLNHKHTVSSLELREAIPYYALAYIMKL